MDRGALALILCLVRAADGGGSAELGWAQFRGSTFRDGTTTAVGPKTDGTAWRFLMRGAAQTSPSTHPDGSLIYVGGADGLYGVTRDGTFAFLARVGKGIYNSAPAVCATNDVVVFGAMDGVVYGVDARSGAQRWRHQTPKQTTGSRKGQAYVYSSAVIDDRGVAYIGAADGSLLALATDPMAAERLLWSFNARNEPIWSSPALSADQKTLYVGGVDNFVHAVSTRDGTTLWEFETGGFPDDPDDPDVDSSPAVSRRDGTVYVGSFDNRLHALDGKSGKVKWSYATTDDVISSPAVSRDGKTAFIASTSGWVHAIDAKKGTKKWTTNLGGEINSETIIDGAGTLYVGCDNGNLYALDSKKGNVKWTHSIGDKVRGEPAVANGMVYITAITSDEFLHAIGPSTPAPAPATHSSSTSEGVSGAWKAYAIVLTLLIIVAVGGGVYIAPRLGGPQVGWERAGSTTANPFIELSSGPGYAPPGDGIDGI